MFKILELSSDYYAQGPRFVSTFQPTYSFNYVSKGLLIHVSVKLVSSKKNLQNLYKITIVQSEIIRKSLFIEYRLYRDI